MQLAVPQKHLGPKAFFAVVLGVNLITIVSIDTYVPALPGMQASFGVTESFLNLTLFLFFLTSAIGTLVAGPLSDKMGRRPVLIGLMVLYAAGSAACALAPNIALLVVFRIFQAVAYGASLTLCTSLIQDSYEGDDLQLAITMLQSLIIVGPVVAPFLGTLILAFFSWRAIFWFLAILGVLGIFMCLLVSETMQPTPEQRRASLLKTMTAGMGSLARQRRFTSLSFFMGVAGIPYFAFIAVVSYILLNFFKMDYLGYSIIYAVSCLVTVIAPYVYIALSKRMADKSIMKIAMGAVLLTFVLMACVGTRNPWLFLVAFVPYALAEGVIRPMSFVELLDQPPHLVGAASSLSNLVYCVMTSVGTVIATLAWGNFVTGLTVITGGTLIILVVLFFIWRKPAAAGDES